MTRFSPIGPLEHSHQWASSRRLRYTCPTPLSTASASRKPRIYESFRSSDHACDKNPSKFVSIVAVTGSCSSRNIALSETRDTNIRYKTSLCPSQIRGSRNKIRQTALLAIRSAACPLNKVWQAYSRERKDLEAMLTAVDLIARCESGFQPPRVAIRSTSDDFLKGRLHHSVDMKRPGSSACR